VLEGLHVERLDWVLRRVAADREASRNTGQEKARIKAIISNIETAVGPAITEGYASFRKPVLVKAEGRRFLKPDLVIGPRRKKRDNFCLEPTIIVRKAVDSAIARK
jgi:hypothetical protein